MSNQPNNGTLQGLQNGANIGSPILKLVSLLTTLAKVN
jgi:hypothetical protein